MESEDLGLLARQLSDEGIEAHDLYVPVPGKGTQIGVMIVGIGFFQLWELNNPENVGLIANREFATIKAKRPRNWEMVELRFWDKQAVPKGE